MSAASRRKITITYSGDVDGEEVINAARNTSSPASIQLLFIPEYEGVLADVNVSVFAPTGARALTILKPSDNEYRIYMRGTTIIDVADTLALSPTEPDSISMDSEHMFYFASLNPAGVLLRLFWS